MHAAWRRATWGVTAFAVAVVVLRIWAYPWPVSDPVHSRWLTLESLVEDKTFAVGYRVPEDGGGYRDIGRVTTLRTVDVMLDPETKTFYSSKPPLLQVLYAPLVKGFVWLSGADDDIALHRAQLMRWLLLLVHALPFALFLAWLTQWWLAREPATVAFVLVCLAGFGTFLTTFSNAISNHVPAAFATLVALIGLLRVVVQREDKALWYALAGLGAGAAAALEYPAAAFVAAALVILARVSLLRALAFFLPAAAFPLFLAFAIDAAVFQEPLFFFTRDKAWFYYDGSYWSRTTGLDEGEDSFAAYAFHSLLGHHGALLLTPFFGVALGAALVHLAESGARRRLLWLTLAAVLLVLLPGALRHGLDAPYRLTLLALAPAFLLPLAWPRRDVEGPELLLARLLLAATLPTLAFYLGWTSNYGGITSGPRWLLWLTPLWLVVLPAPLRSLLALSRGRLLVAVLVGLSFLAVLWPGANPYRHPWSFALYERAVIDVGRDR